MDSNIPNQVNDTIEVLNEHIKQIERKNEECIKDINFLRKIIDNLSIKIEKYKIISESSSLEAKKQKDNNIILNNENNNLKNKIKDLNHNLKNLENIIFFSNFHKFLSRSHVSPNINAPFSNEQKQNLIFMESITSYLIDNLNQINDLPLVSVIMPVYNRVDIIHNSITSVLNQTYKNIELIIIDDGSDDGTSDLLKELEDNRIKVLFNEVNKGASFSRNEGLKASNGEYIAYLDSDNDWDSRYISAMIGGFLELNDADALYSGQILYDKYNSPIKGVRFGSYNKSLLHNKNYIDMNCFCHKKSIINDIGGFDTKLKRLVDWDFILNISNNYTIYSIPILLSNYYSNNATNRIDNIQINKNEYTKYILEKNKFTTNKNILKRDVNIILLNYESREYIKKCVEKILSFKLNKLKIIIVNNHNNTETIDYLNKLNENENIELVNNDKYFKFTDSLIQGLRLCDDNADLMILNSIALLSEGSIENMQYYAYSLKNVGIIVPQQVISKGKKVIKRHVPYADYFYECDVNTSYYYRNIINIPIFHNGNVLELNFAPFFCTYIKREVFNNSCGFNNELADSYFFSLLFCEYIRNVMNLKIYHISEIIVKNIHDTPEKYLDYSIYKPGFIGNNSVKNKFN